MAAATTEVSQDHSGLWAFDATTSLPTMMEFPQSHVKLLDDFFHVVDASATDAKAFQELGPLFTDDGVWKTPSATFSGVDQIMDSGHTWERFKTTKLMRHWVRRVYVNDKAGRQLMVLGVIRIEPYEGRVVEKHFGAWVEIKDIDDGERSIPRLRLFQGWSSQQ